MCLCVFIPHVCEYPWIPAKGAGSPGSGVRDVCELLT